MINAKRAQQRLADRGFAIKADGDFGGKSFAALMTFVGSRTMVSPLRTDLGKAAAKYFATAGLTTPLRIAHALGLVIGRDARVQYAGREPRLYRHRAAQHLWPEPDQR